MRSNDPDAYVRSFEYNADGQMTRMALPEGNSVEYAYDSGNADRLQHGNLLSVTRLPDADRGGDQPAITTSFAYEPIYNQVRAVTEARGNDAGFEPQNSAVGSPERYTTAFTFDYE